MSLKGNKSERCGCWKDKGGQEGDKRRYKDTPRWEKMSHSTEKSGTTNKGGSRD